MHRESYTSNSFFDKLQVLGVKFRIQSSGEHKDLRKDWFHKTRLEANFSFIDVKTGK